MDILKKDGNEYEDSDELQGEDYQEIFKEKKKELLLENRRSRVTTMAFHDWFVKTYHRDFKQADRAISEAYHAGAADEVENNEYILEHNELKMNHYRKKLEKQSDSLQILFSLLEAVTRKPTIPDELRKLITRTLVDK